MRILSDVSIPSMLIVPLSLTTKQGNLILSSIIPNNSRVASVNTETVASSTDGAMHPTSMHGESRRAVG